MRHNSGGYPLLLGRQSPGAARRRRDDKLGNAGARGKWSHLRQHSHRWSSQLRPDGGGFRILPGVQQLRPARRQHHHGSVEPRRGQGRLHICKPGNGRSAYLRTNDDCRDLLLGSQRAYELGDGTNLDHPTPVAVQSTISFANLGSAVGSHTCGVTGSGLGYCWGDNIFGQIGDGTTASVAPTPHAVAGALTFVAVSGGSDHSCGLSTAHIAYCWGFNGNGQLGTGPLGGTSPTPVPVVGQVP